MTDGTLPRLLDHMGWANGRVFTQLVELPESALSLSAWNPQWTVGTIANHIVLASGRLISRITGDAAPAESEPAVTTGQMRRLIDLAAERDRRLRGLVDEEDGPREFLRYGEPVRFQASTILAQAVHHATEHRAQIADVLAINGLDVIDLDSLDLWSYELWQRSS